MSIHIKTNMGYMPVRIVTGNTLYGATQDTWRDKLKRRILAAWTEFRRRLAERIYCDRGGKG